MATETEITSFIDEMGPLVVAEANRRIANGEGFVVPSVVMAQAAHETGWGTSSRMTKANAYFGIKAGGSWTGAVFTADTWEVANGEAYNTSANFRAYNSKAESVADYFDLITKAERYANAVSYHPDDIKTAYDTLHAIWSAGYATDENYVANVYDLLTGRSLQTWDLQVDGVSTIPAPSITGPVLDTTGPMYIFKRIDTPKVLEIEKDSA